MKGFFFNLLSPSRNKRRKPREAEQEAAHVSTRGETVEIRIDRRRSSGEVADTGRWAEPAVGHSGFGLSSPDGRIAIVGSGNFGVQACSKEDFMKIQATVMDAFARVEAQFGVDEAFAEEIESEIDILFDEFEQLKELLVRAQHDSCGTDYERDVTRLKSRIHDIVDRINASEQEYCQRKGERCSSPSTGSESEEAGAARGIETLSIE